RCLMKWQCIWRCKF
ncbi:DUF3709 domain-containing protein, partial [Vibrio cholerae]